jgi:hypothetical protein
LGRAGVLAIGQVFGGEPQEYRVVLLPGGCLIVAVQDLRVGEYEGWSRLPGAMQSTVGLEFVLGPIVGAELSITPAHGVGG